MHSFPIFLNFSSFGKTKIAKEKEKYLSGNGTCILK